VGCLPVPYAQAGFLFCFKNSHRPVFVNLRLNDQLKKCAGQAKRRVMGWGELSEAIS